MTKSYRIYLAARFQRQHEMQEYRTQLLAAGHIVMSTWIDGEAALDTMKPELHEVYLPIWAKQDRNDLRDSDVLIAFTELPSTDGSCRGGRHVELGMALAWGTRCIIVGPRENVFCWLPGITCCTNFEQALLALGE